MRTVTEWAHLPNAKYIDMLLADVEARPLAWHSGTALPNKDLRASSLDTAIILLKELNRAAAWNAVKSSLETNREDAAQCAVIALLAYDRCSHLLGLTPAELTDIAELNNADSPAATLLLPAVIALRKKTAVITAFPPDFLGHTWHI